VGSGFAFAFVFSRCLRASVVNICFDCGTVALWGMLHSASPLLRNLRVSGALESEDIAAALAAIPYDYVT
jgi:hypothetical protein